MRTEKQEGQGFLAKQCFDAKKGTGLKCELNQWGSLRVGGAGEAEMKPGDPRKARGTQLASCWVPNAFPG